LKLCVCVCVSVNVWDVTAASAHTWHAFEQQLSYKRTCYLG